MKNVEVRKSFLDSDTTYGARRVWRDVLDARLDCGLHAIERLMQANALRPRRRRLPSDTAARPATELAANILDRQFHAPAPNCRWVADFTYIWTLQRWLYVAVVLDLFSRGIVGWSMRSSMTADLVSDALMMALWRRGRPRELGYARVSTDDQNLSIQKTALEADKCSIVFEEKKSATKRLGRAQLDLALKVLQQGDTLVVTRLDRLGRSLRDLANIAHEIDSVGAHLRVIEQSVDTATSAGRAFFGMLAVFAQFETDVRRDRQAEGIARAKKAGVYTGGKPRISRPRVADRLKAGDGPAAIARSLGISRMSVYRIMREAGL